MALDPDVRRQLAKQLRLWLLSLVCATLGATVVWRTGDLLVGVLAFLATVAVLGSLLWVYEAASVRALWAKWRTSRDGAAPLT
jgi:hypothetical protein